MDTKKLLYDEKKNKYIGRFLAFLGSISPLNTALDGTEKIPVVSNDTAKTITVSSLMAKAGVLDSTEYTANHTLVAENVGKLVKMNKATAVNVTVPPDVFTVGQVISVQQTGAGTVSFVAGSGVTIRSKGGSLAMSGQYSGVSLRCEASNVFWLYGGLA